MRRILKNLLLLPYVTFHKIVFKVSPIKKNRFVFMSYHGKYTDSPRFISEYLHQRNSKAQILWLVNESFLHKLPNYVLAKDISKLSAWWYLGSAQVIFDNVYCNKEYTWFADEPFSNIMYRLHSILMSKSNQLAFTTFHGTPLKKMDRDQVGNTIKGFICPNTTLLLESQYSAKLYKHLTFNNLGIEVLGSPRVEQLCLYDEERINGIKNRLGVDQSIKLALYAPTFRNDGKDTQGKNVRRSGLDQLNSMQIDLLMRAFSNKFGGEWRFLIRFHQHVEKLVDWENLNSLYHGMIINGNQIEEMNDCLSVSDVLLTDFSSCMFDYMMLNRPCFIYAPDLERYINVERGLYIDIKQLPFPFSVTFNELLHSVGNFNECYYLKKLTSFKENLGYTEIAGSISRMVDYILAKQVEKDE